MKTIHTTQCSNCGNEIKIQCGGPRRHNRWGTGYHDAKNIRKLGWSHMLALQILEENNAFDGKSGMTSRHVWHKGEVILKAEKKYWTLTGVRARLCEMQGEGPFQMVGSVPNKMVLEDEEQQKFRLEKGNKWFLLRREGLGLLKVTQ